MRGSLPAPGRLAAVAGLLYLALVAGAGAAPATSPAAEGASPLLQRVTLDGWREHLEARRGSILVVDFWATWCLPCLERFPEMVKLHGRYAERGVEFASVSLDDVGDAAAVAQAERFLAEQKTGPGFSHFLIDESVPRAFEGLGLLAIPAVYVYDREGALAERLTTDDPNAQFTEADVEEAIRALLARE
jgi:thiol-disulfide isomerase/thioredoxin